MTETLTIAFLPLVDAALPILAQELGFAEDEGLSLSFVRESTWATVLDRLLYGHCDAAHMVAPLTIATTLGIGRPARPLSVPFVLGLNGNAVTFATDLARAVHPDAGLGDPFIVGARLKAIAAARKQAGAPLRLGVVHRYSSHNYMLRYWLAACGIQPDEDVAIVTIPPPFAADSLESGEVDGICVGEPWNSVAVERGVGRIVLATAQIWRRGVEKVLAMRTDRMEERSDNVQALIRALHRAGAAFVDPDRTATIASILARPQYLDGHAERIERAMTDHLMIGLDDPVIHYPDFMFQHREAANFPWISQAQWLYSQMIRWERRPFDAAEAARAAAIFRPDMYRRALADGVAALPGASSKVEGGISGLLPVGSTQGQLVLSDDRFFDGRHFDPDHIAQYLAELPPS